MSVQQVFLMYKLCENLKSGIINFNHFFNIPTHAHNMYTLKSTKLHIKNP